MKLIDRYLLREYLVPLSYCLVGFCMLYVVGAMFDTLSQAINAGAPLIGMVEYYACFLVAYAKGSDWSFFVIALPVSILGGTLYSLSTLTKQNEITALRANGISIFRIMRPFIGVGLVFSLLAVGFQEYVAPRASRIIDDFDQTWRGKTKMAERVQLNYAYRDQEHRATWKIARFDSDRPTVLDGVKITIDRPSSPARARVFEAEKAEWVDGTWRLYGMTEQRFDAEDQPIGPPPKPIAGPVNVPELKAHPDHLVIELDPRNLGRYMSSLDMLRYLRKRQNMQPSELANRRASAHLCLAMPWACLVVALLGIPAGTRGGQRGAFAGVNFAVALFLAFYVTVQISLFLGMKQVLSPVISAWLPNVVFFTAGSVMLARMR